jgi:two-component system invasion response regulator UvrY
MTPAFTPPPPTPGPASGRGPCNAPARLLLVDDHTLVREGLKRILQSMPEGWELEEAADAESALEALRRRHFELALLDLSLPGMSGLELIRRARSQYPQLRLMVLTMHAEVQYAVRAFKGGAQAYLTKDSASTELVAAVRKVLGGGRYVCNALAEGMLHALTEDSPQQAPHHSLSHREMEVFQRLLAGLRPMEVAQVLHLSVKTVSTHKARIMDKLGIRTLSGLIRYGLEHQLLEPGVPQGLAAAGAAAAPAGEHSLGAHRLGAQGLSSEGLHP